MVTRREIELKLNVGSANVDKLVAAPILTGVSSRKQAQTSTYFDTPEQALRTAGLSLRIRTIGKRRIQTVKAESVSAVGMFARPEWEMSITRNRPVIDDGDGNPLHSLIGAHDLRRLAPIFRIVVTRQTFDIRQDGTRIELVIDQGEIVANCQTAPVCEVELELKEGSPASVFALARTLDAVAPLQLSALSKSQSGYRMFDANGGLPIRWTPLLLSGETTTSEGFEAIALACIRQFRLNQLILTQTKCAEALHQARVALRRLRSTLLIFEALVIDYRLKHLLAELRWVTRELDRARNIDVLLVRVTEANAQVPLQIARAHAYATVSAALVSSRLRTLMLDLVEWITIGSWRTERSNHLVDHKLGTFAVVALDACRRDVQRRGRYWKRLDDKGRHRLRIQAKKLRYAVDFFGMLFPNKKAALRHQPFLEALRALQTHLGDMNDRVVGAALLTELGLPGVTVGNTGKGTLRKSSSILKDARADYDTLIHLKPFWR